jgi:hypothetical protein
LLITGAYKLKGGENYVISLLANLESLLFEIFQYCKAALADTSTTKKDG